EKERQRLESLRRKQEAEEERRKKVEEEKRRRQAEMKQKREERLRKALQARERVEQMEEEKKKRMEQKILQSDEKGRLSHVREEKVGEERGRKKLSKKCGEAEARRQRAPRAVRAVRGPSCLVFFLLQEESESEQPEPLQKRREDEVKEKGKRVWELRKLVEQRQMEQGKERYGLVLSWRRGPGGVGLQHVQRREQGLWEGRSARIWWWELSWSPGAGALGCLQGLEHLDQVSPPWQGELSCQPGASASCTNHCLWFQKSISASCLGPPKAARESGSPAVDENDYGMDLNSDDSTDDENEPRKPVPAWADGAQLNEAIVHQYYHPTNIDQLFGLIPSPRLEDIFGKSKPRYFKRTSSAVWHSPP
ncbi:INCE protein, partial [Crotophaga sulcirostris]|nr:INCE protein [Crotophaga sulcirostris]